jgi:hypothetical protein
MADWGNLVRRLFLYCGTQAELNTPRALNDLQLEKIDCACADPKSFLVYLDVRFGQKQIFSAQKGMSALPPIATLDAYFRTSAKGQKRTLVQDVSTVLRPPRR